MIKLWDQPDKQKVNEAAFNLGKSIILNYEMNKTSQKKGIYYLECFKKQSPTGENCRNGFIPFDDEKGMDYLKHISKSIDFSSINQKDDTNIYIICSTPLNTFEEDYNNYMALYKLPII